MSDTTITPMSAEGIKQLRDLLMYRNDVCGPGLAYFSPERALALIAAYDSAEARAEKAEADAKEWKEQIPEECPITGLPYFNSFKTSAGVYQPFYGGPCDVYGIPYKDEDGYLCRKRLCLDSMREEDENMCLEVVEEERMIDLEQAEARAEELEEYIAKLVCELTDGKLSKPYDISVITDEVESIYRAYAEDEIAKATAKTEAENARLRAELETAKQVAASAQAVALCLSIGNINRR